MVWAGGDAAPKACRKRRVGRFGFYRSPLRELFGFRKLHDRLLSVNSRIASRVHEENCMYVPKLYGRGVGVRCGVGVVLGVAVIRGVDVGLAVAVGVDDTVGVGLAVGGH